jgi:hypothetical protein
MTGLTVLEASANPVSVRTLRDIIAILPESRVHHSLGNLNFYCSNLGCDEIWNRCECDHSTDVVCEDCGEICGFIVIRMAKYCTKLTEFSLSSTADLRTHLRESDIAQFSRMVNLEHLRLANLNLSSIAPFVGLTNLQTLQLSSNRFNESQRNELREALPNTVIYF